MQSRRCRLSFNTLILSIWFALAPTQLFAGGVHALHSVQHTGTRIVAKLPASFVPVYQLRIDAKKRDILRLAAHLQVVEDKQRLARVWAYLSVRPVSGEPVRVSPFAWQNVMRQSFGNHYTVLNLFGHFQVPSTGEYLVEMMARDSSGGDVYIEHAVHDKTTSDVAANNPTCKDAEDYGQIIAEQYRPYSSKEEALAAGAKLLFGTARARRNLRTNFR